MQACWESLEKAMPADVKLKYRTNTKTEGKNGGHVSSTVWTNLGEFEFSFWASLYADDAALPLSSREGLLAAINAIHKNLRLFGLLMHVGAPGKESKTETMYCPARDEEYEAWDTSDLVLDCGGTVSFTQSFVYLGSLLHRDLSDHHGVDARIKKPPRPSVRYVIISSVLAMCLSGSKGRSTLVVFWRYYCMGANRGASRLSPSLACATGITNAYVKCAR